ncbi:MAG TPA: hypothetical protein VFN21_08980 [Acidimicrobiales bacterium]|nr:hypothetical protein [Acidimicrobiales bacterium]
MPTTNRGADASLGTLIVAPAEADTFWPVETRWRGVVPARGEFRSPEWMLRQVKAVPLSSRVERSLLESARSDDGRSILELASEPGEHRVAAAVIAALRLATDYPDRSLRFLAWIAQGPNDPGDLRFLRRYLPGLHVLVRLDSDVGAAVPLGSDALGLLAAELFRETGDLARADQVLEALTPCAPVAVARAALRIAGGDATSAHALAENRPVTDDVTALLRIVDARARIAEGDPNAALSEVNELLQGRPVAVPVDRAARSVRSQALRATGRDVEANLIDDDFGAGAAKPTAETASSEPPTPPLFGRTLSDALDDAWARVRCQPLQAPVEPILDQAQVDAHCEQAVALIAAGHHDTAESMLLAAMDRADAWVDQGGRVVDDYFVLLAGLFDRQQLTIEELATLERLRAAHRRAGTELSDEVTERLVEAQAVLDNLR